MVIQQLLLPLLLLCADHASARSSGGGYACNDGTASLCSLECPNTNRRAWATYQPNGVLSPCCPAGMDMVAPPTRNKGYRIQLKGVGQVAVTADVIAEAERTKAAADAATKAEADARAEHRSTAGVGANEGKNCFRNTRYTQFIQWPSTTHYQQYVPCRPGGPKPESANNANKKQDRLCDFKKGSFCDAVSGFCDFCGTPDGTLGKCCKQGERENGCSGTEGGLNSHKCVAVDSDAVKKAAVAATAARKAAQVGAVSANRVKSYTPCELIEVSIIVDNPKLKYLGLLAYFENDQGEKVGSWVLPSEVAASGGETTFNTCNNGAAVMHANAALKHYTQTFRYQTPVEGTGSLTLRVLIKHGITNGGAFFWPGTLSTSARVSTSDVVTEEYTGDLRLSEQVMDSNSRNERWFVAAKGETCDSACARMSGGSGRCNAQAMIELSKKMTSKEQYAPSGKFYACRRPLVVKQITQDTAKCAASTFTVDTDDGWCYWRQPALNLDCVVDRLSECSTASNEEGRVCACDNTKDVDYTKQCPSPFLTSQNEAVHTDANKDWADADAAAKQAAAIAEAARQAAEAAEAARAKADEEQAAVDEAAALAGQQNANATAVADKAKAEAERIAAEAKAALDAQTLADEGAAAAKAEAERIAAEAAAALAAQTLADEAAAAAKKASEDAAAAAQGNTETDSRYDPSTNQCFVKLPTGCSKATDTWTTTPTEWFYAGHNGVKQLAQAKTESKCKNQRKGDFNSYCNIKDAMAEWGLSKDYLGGTATQAQLDAAALAAQAAADAAAAALQAKTDAERIATEAAAALEAQTRAEEAEAQAKIDAERIATEAAAALEAQTRAEEATAAAQKAQEDAEAAAVQAKIETDAAAAAQAKAEAEAKAAADLDAAAAQAKAEADAKAERGSAQKKDGSAGSASSGAGSDNGGNSGCVDSIDGDDRSATMDDATRTKLRALDITLEVSFRREMVRIHMSGPSHKWIGVSFGATVMAQNPYAVVWEENKVSERMLREYSAGLILKHSSMTFIESCDDMSIRKNTCMRPIVVTTGGGSNDRRLTVDTYYSFAKLQEFGGAVDFMLALGHTKNFGYHSNVVTGVLTFPAPPTIVPIVPIVPDAEPDDDDDETTNNSASGDSRGWIAGLIVGLVCCCCFLGVFAGYWYLNREKDNTKDLPAVATVDIEMSTNPAAPKIANPLDDFRSNHRIDHLVVEMSAKSANLETASTASTVDTLFGAGTVATTRDDGTQVIRLTDWKLTAGNVAVLYLPRSQEQDSVDSVGTQVSVSRKKSLKVNRKKQSLKRGGSSGTSPALLCFLCLFSILYKGSLFCDAHNWLNNPPSRASKTSTVTPCPPADLSRPAHMQVGMNQDFEVEFMSGHSYTNTYFAIIRHEDENKLKYHSEGMFQKYIANAPEGATVPAPERTHVSCSAAKVYTGWEKKLEDGDPEYIKRPGSFFGKHCNGGQHQFKYTAAMRKNDIFTSYTNSKWPWLVGVYRFKHGKSFPDEFDTVRLKIPERTGSAGRHIVQYIWRGYRDCIDVNVLPQGLEASDKWGKEGKKVWRRIDHCQFENYMGNPVRVDKNNHVSTNRPARTPCNAAKTKKGLQTCLDACNSKALLDKSRDWSCTGVNVVPMVNPLTTAPMFHDFSRCEGLKYKGVPIDISTHTIDEHVFPEGVREQCLKEWQDAEKAGPKRKTNTQEKGCIKKYRYAMEAEYLACRKSIVNIPWASSILARAPQLDVTQIGPKNAGICIETDAFKDYAKNDPMPLVCYGVQTYLGPRQHEQNVGELWRVTDDPSDPVFYSSCMIWGPLERTFKGTSCGEDCILPTSSVSSTEWKFGDQCIGCDLATRQYTPTQTPKWMIGTDEKRPCEVCDKWEAPKVEEKCQNTVGWNNGAKKATDGDCYRYKIEGWCKCPDGSAKCNDGQILNSGTTGATKNFPERNCCVCGGSKEKAIALRL